ncbi:YdeI/OmpD-associated family protein [Flavobacterium muglaense]|uniref:DUF1801 domain-containing protein n=1 Tax=Flavobacterium muglaense TaxID=2764716 RepID=A0A923SEB2_9FLAO|nr:DUF1801 domain-containing protein [Flavobacterium muglaense]MBC5836514.1 DUF1801 domain-containing protein [Flavobacterium muglaense]MBC5843220.1 DUF1801 domain-containing protein [Flavobacterium muglaense]
MDPSVPKKHSWDKNNNWTEELNRLKVIIAQTELVETIKWGAPTYVLNGKNIIGIGGFKSYFGIWFFNGVFLKDEHKLLVNAQEGVTKSLRQWRFNSIKEIDEKRVLTYVLEAIANEKAGKSSNPTVKKTVISVQLQLALDSNDTLAKAFQKFTAAKKREFHDYIEEAKRDTTKITRIEKLNHYGLKVHRFG